jgi:hypothetical protein
LKSSLIKKIGLVVIALCCWYPPYHEKIKYGASYTYKSLGNHYLLWPPQRGEIDIQSLVLELIVVICITLVFIIITRDKKH